MTNDTDAENDIGRIALERVETLEYLQSETREQLAQKLTADQLATYPHRNPKRLEEAWNNSDTLRDLAERLDCDYHVASRWLATYGIREKSSRPHIMLQGFDADELARADGGSA